MAVRAKFKVHSVMKSAGWNGQKEVHTVKLTAVSGSSDENARFYAATPSGSIELTAVRQDIGELFPIGGEFYVDFMPAPVAA